MNMGPSFMGQSGSVRIDLEQLIKALSPLAAESEEALRSGAPPDEVLTDSLLAGFLIGAGMSPSGAYEVVMQHRMSAGARLRLSVEKAMQDEAQAGVLYRWLLERASMDLNEARAIQHIRHALEDERKHYRLLGGLYRELTGKPHEARPQPLQAPRDLADGLKQALDGEYEAAEFYRDLYLETRDQGVRDLFFELMTDEMDHIPRFNYVLTLLMRENG